jgi:AraC-like DNA-binding protein
MEQPRAAEPTDLMSLALDEMRLRRAVFEHERFETPWSSKRPPGKRGLYLVLSGQLQLNGPTGGNNLSAGDLVLLPASPPHELHGPRRAGRAAPCELLSASLEFYAADHPLFDVLPAVIHAPRALLAASPGCASYLEQLALEALNPKDGADALLSRLSEVVLIEVMRFFARPPGVECPVTGWFAGLRDPSLRRALVAMHQQPSKSWTVEMLAKVARESRSAFAAHFTSVMQQSPMAYLAHWRMFQSRNLLRQTDLSLEDIAERVGYGSAAAFALAFTRSQGIAPGAFRKREHAENERGGDAQALTINAARGLRHSISSAR